MSASEPDQVLAPRAAQGDRRAFDTLVRRHYAGLVQAARSFGIPETDVDDVAQETFIAAWKALAEYDPDRPFRAWLFHIGLNKMRDLLRFRKVRHFLFGALGLQGDDEAPDGAEAPQVADPVAGPERAVAARRELDLVVRTLDRLERGQREALVLTAIVGLSQPEAALAMGVTPKALERRIARGRAALAALIDT